MMILACIDGGLFCIGIPVLLATLFPWVARKVYKVCKRSCGCGCHPQNKPKTHTEQVIADSRKVTKATNEALISILNRCKK